MYLMADSISNQLPPTPVIPSSSWGPSFGRQVVPLRSELLIFYKHKTSSSLFTTLRKPLYTRAWRNKDQSLSLMKSLFNKSPQMNLKLKNHCRQGPGSVGTLGSLTHTYETFSALRDKRADLSLRSIIIGIRVWGGEGGDS